MALKSSREAVREAQRLLGLAADDEGAAWHVRRLDQSGSAYFLVHIAGQILCLDANGGTLLASAKATVSPVAMTREAAIQRAGLGPRADAELVWKPSVASLSMFDPFWEVKKGEETIYVVQRGNVWNSIHTKRPGGGPN